MDLFIYRVYLLKMAEIQHDSSSDSESSEVLEGTPPKENYNKTILIRSLVSKKINLKHAVLSEPEKSSSKKKDEKECPLYHPSSSHVEKGSKTSLTEKETLLRKGNKFGMLSSRSPQRNKSFEKQSNKYGKALTNQSQAHSSSEKGRDDDKSDERRYRRSAIEVTDSDSSGSTNGDVTDTSEEALPSPKLVSKAGKQKQRWNVIQSSDSEASVEGKGENLTMPDSPKLLKSSSLMGSYRKNTHIVVSSDSETVETPQKISTIYDISRSKYREKECLIVSSDSEESMINENIEKLSISAESSLESISDKNTVDNISIEGVRSDNENISVLETSNLAKFPVKNKPLKLLNQNTLKVNECLVKTVEACDHASSDGIQEQTSNDSESVQQARTKNESNAHCNDSTLLLKEVSSSSLHDLTFKFLI
jgi:hypothetical protein